MDIQEQKQQLRKEMAALKRQFSAEELVSLSAKVLGLLEETELFRQASCIALYHAIPGEVQTHDFIEKWYKEKKILLPIIIGNDLKLLHYLGKHSLQPGPFGILEPSPSCCPKVSEKEIDCIIVPGIAFDRRHNRMGRGKGYYDRLLNSVTAPKAGVCFHFQLVDRVPTDTFDKKMDYVITDQEIIYPR